MKLNTQNQKKISDTYYHKNYMEDDVDIKGNFRSHVSSLIFQNFIPFQALNFLIFLRNTLYVVEKYHLKTDVIRALHHQVIKVIYENDLS